KSIKAMSSSSAKVSNNLMNIQDEMSEFASVDHLGSIFLNGIEMMIELSNKGSDSQEFNKSVDSFKQTIRQNKSRDDKRESDPLRNAGYEFCEAISMAFSDLSKKAKVARVHNEMVLARPSHQSHSNKPTRETRSSGKRTILLERRIAETVVQPVEPLRLLRCGDCPAIFKHQTARLEHRRIHAIEGPSVADSVKSRAERKRKVDYSHDKETVIHPVKAARLSNAALPPIDELECQYCEKQYKTTRWLNKHLMDKHNVVV
ncbi:hypothetical protein PRIPAC_85367, partial [Pristionchus pacificus]|uniref:C2H2-type domain-containing protein n=1 Tax=Pristionchus pacificus TaxID=54126 RepID=A0A2A6BNJ2_PRIPA